MAAASEKTARHVVIIGGGITGLSAAWEIQQNHSANQFRFTLLEKSDR